MSEMTLKAVVMLRQRMHCFKLEKKRKKAHQVRIIPHSTLKQDNMSFYSVHKDPEITLNFILAL